MSKISLIIKIDSLKFYWLHIKEALKYKLFECFLFLYK